MTPRLTRRAGLLLAAAWPLTAPAIDFGRLFASSGSGRIVPRVVPLQAFDTIELGGSLVLSLLQAQEPRLTIETDDNLVDRIEVVQQGGTLSLSSSGHIAPTKLRIVAQVWKLENLHASGSARVEAGTLVAKTLELKLGGSSVVRFDRLTAEVLRARIGGSAALKVAAGQANELDAALGGSGVLDAASMQVRRAGINVSGSAVAKVWVSEALGGHISGSGLLRYRGEPAVSVTHSGAGQVRKA